MSAKQTRIDADLSKIAAIATKSNGAVKIVSHSSTRINLQLHFKTIANSSGSFSEVTDVEIQLPDRYPFIEPKVVFTSKVFHPNVYSSGQVCLGTKWLPSEGLDLLVERLIKILIYDATILNTKSPADSSALNWYRKTVSKNPSIFPTDKFEKNSVNKKPKIKWTDSSKESQKDKIISCGKCGQKLRVPLTGTGKIKCPKCQSSFII